MLIGFSILSNKPLIAAATNHVSWISLINIWRNVRLSSKTPEKQTAHHYF